MKKISSIFVCYALIVIVEGNMFAGAVRGGIEPMILGIGAAFTALGGLDSYSMDGVSHFSWKGVKKWFKDLLTPSDM